MEKTNQIIIDYMEFEKTSENEYHIKFRDDNRNLYLNEPHVGINFMKFHTSWDWLVPVWHKLATECWNKGITIDHMKADFDCCVSRNAPKNAYEIVTQGITNYIK